MRTSEHELCCPITRATLSESRVTEYMQYITQHTAAYTPSEYPAVASVLDWQEHVSENEEEQHSLQTGIVLTWLSDTDGMTDVCWAEMINCCLSRRVP